MLKEADESFRYYFFLHASETLARLESTPKLVVAAINGHCLGGGLEVALACDLRIARAGAAQIGLADVELGLLPGTGGLSRLARIAGKARAMELAVEGQRLSVGEARAAGLVHRSFETPTSEAFVRQVVDYAHGFCPPGRATLAVGAIKRAIQSGAEASREEALALERELAARQFQSHDGREGLAAFAQKRKPSFHGR
jgi:enoyl-CoA hydratase/carnithine racemase